MDLGCNSGFYCRYARSKGATRVVGVDADKKVIERARQEAPEIEYRDTGWDDFPEGVFDVVIFLSAIHYAIDPCSVVDNIHRSMPAGGCFVLEGGLFDADGLGPTDMLIPSWRKVGDRCRHLSLGYVQNHLLRGFEWKVFGASEPRGGDAVPRHVIHATPREAVARPHYYSLDVADYLRKVRQSADNIVPAQKSYEYVTALGKAPFLMDDFIYDILAGAKNFDAFVDDIAFAVAGRDSRPIRISEQSAPKLHRRLIDALSVRGLGAFVA